MRIFVLSAMVAATLALSGAGIADERSVTDSPDHPGQMSFDIASASHEHSRRSSRYPAFLSHTVVAANPVSAQTFAEEDIRIRFNFDMIGDEISDRSIELTMTADGFQGDMWKDGYPLLPEDFNDPIDWVGFVRITRPDDRSVRVEFPRKFLGRLGKDGAYRWMVEVYRMPGYSSWCGPNDAPPCYDRTKWVKHYL